MIERKRIGNLEFRQATYLLPENEYPKNPSYHIDYWFPNGYYGRESEFIKDGDWYRYADETLSFARIHKDCFKHKESCMAIASFNYDKEGYYELCFVGDRPLNITPEEREIFWELIKYGYEQLNNQKNDEEE